MNSLKLEIKAADIEVTLDGEVAIADVLPLLRILFNRDDEVQCKLDALVGRMRASADRLEARIKATTP